MVANGTLSADLYPCSEGVGAILFPSLEHLLDSLEIRFPDLAPDPGDVLSDVRCLNQLAVKVAAGRRIANRNELGTNPELLGTHRQENVAQSGSYPAEAKQPRWRDLGLWHLRDRTIRFRPLRFTTLL